MNYFDRSCRFTGDLAIRHITAITSSIALVVLFADSRALAADPFGVYITKFCSDTGHNQLFEFVQVTNLGSSPINMAGWSEDDNNAKPNQTGHSLSGLGTLSPGQSGVITQATPADFETYWWGSPAAAPANFNMVGGYSNDNLSTSADSITLFDGSKLEDRLDYTTATGNGDTTVRDAPIGVVGTNDDALWINSSPNDGFGSFRAQGISPFPGIFGNPAFYTVPEPTGLSILCLSLLPMLARRRRI
jgi:hypothetical protein